MTKHARTNIGAHGRDRDLDGLARTYLEGVYTNGAEIHRWLFENGPAPTGFSRRDPPFSNLR